jgi:hypothetical protein
MLITKRQKAIIKRICSAQEKSFMRILEQKIDQIKFEMTNEGYNVSESDILEQLAMELEQWDKVKNDPAMFINILDEQNKGMIKHHLVNSYINNEDAQPIWQKLTLYDEASRFQN